MSVILTFLGKGGTGKTTTAIAVARQFAANGQSVLIVSQGIDRALDRALGVTLTCDPQAIAPHLAAVRLQATVLLERYWDKMRSLEGQFLRTPIFQEVYGQELGILPGHDELLALSYLRERDAENNYDVILYDGAGDLSTLRAFGTPDILNWYLRRFRKALTSSTLGQALSPFIDPILRAILQVGSTDDLSRQAGEMTGVLAEGQRAVSDPQRVAAYLVTTADEDAIAMAEALWGSAQQVGLTVGGVLARGNIPASRFAPLPVLTVPPYVDRLAIPEEMSPRRAPAPMVVDVVQRQVRLFLPTFDKRQVKLLQLGPEITIEAGDQRRNLFLPPELAGRQATGAKFQDSYLIISF